ncbi:MAG: hypothetical protein ACM3VV_02290, partial [Deltaproteobacteria bacterium]
SAGRKPRKRGLKPWRGRGTFYKDHPMITCIHQRNGLTYFDVPVLQSLLDIVCSRVQYGTYFDVPVLQSLLDIVCSRVQYGTYFDVPLLQSLL